MSAPLWRFGLKVGVAADRRFSLAGVSRGVRRLRLSTNPLADPEAYAVEIGCLARQLEVRVLLPVTDASVEAIGAGHRLLPPSVALPFPDLSTYHAASDKAEMLDRARCAGLSVPETLLLKSPDDSLPTNAEFFPAVLKPHRSVVRSVVGAVQLAVRSVDTLEACRSALRAFPRAAFPILLQRRVRGSGEGLFLLRWEGRMIAEFAHRRLREKPPDGGVSVYRESIPLDSELATAGRRLLEDLNWQGVAMIECKRDAETGRPVFMEVNGRLWGSLQLAIDSGIDFPRAAACPSCAAPSGRCAPAMVLGRSRPPVPAATQRRRRGRQSRCRSRFLSCEGGTQSRRDLALARSSAIPRRIPPANRSRTMSPSPPRFPVPLQCGVDATGWDVP